MNCPRCNYLINKDYVWSNCPKCNCRLDRETAPAQRVKVSQSKTHNPSASQNVYSSSFHYSENQYQPRRVAEQKQPKVTYCMHCGQKIENGQKFCFRCGNTIYYTDRANNNSPISKKATRKKVWLISSISVVILFVVIIILIVTSPPSPKDLIENSWYYDYGKNNAKTEYYSFGGDGSLVHSKNLDKDLSDFIGTYTVEDDNTLIVRSESGNVNSYTFTELKDENVKKGLYTINDSEWYVSKNYLIFHGKKFVAYDLWGEDESDVDY